MYIDLNLILFSADINECSVNRCKNGGTCENTPGSFVCRCPPGWTGQHCEFGTNAVSVLSFCTTTMSQVIRNKRVILMFS